MPKPPVIAPAGVPASLRWPLPALLAWAAGWLAWGAASTVLPPVAAFGAGLLIGTGVAWRIRGALRRLIAAVGFPLSAVLLGGAGGWPPWGWLLLLLPLAAAYPLRAWSDAPFFPTPAQALDGLDEVVGRPARVLDAGCGLGHGLAALRRLWPQAELHGVEWSRALAWLAARRCPGAHIRRGDMWGEPWGGHDLVYLFQRPESMARAWAKAVSEMPPGAWLVSLEFAVPGQAAHACLRGAGRRPVWVYRPGAAKERSTEGRRGR